MGFPCLTPKAVESRHVAHRYICRKSVSGGGRPAHATTEPYTLTLGLSPSLTHPHLFRFFIRTRSPSAPLPAQPVLGRIGPCVESNPPALVPSYSHLPAQFSASTPSGKLVGGAVATDHGAYKPVVAVMHDGRETNTRSVDVHDT